MNRETLFEQMREDHRRVLERVSALETGVLGPGTFRARAAARRRDEELRDVVALLKRQFATHMAAEEEVLFPALSGSLPHAQATLGPLHAEHVELRAMLQRLDATLRRSPGPSRDEQIAVEVRDIVDLLRIHIRKEESVVLSVAERVLTPQEIESLERLVLQRLHEPETRPAASSGRSSAMKRIIPWSVALLALALTTGCGEQKQNGSLETGVALASPFDGGPRAGEAPVAEALAEQGAALFKSKGCSACHAFGRRLTCPDLKGVTMRRTSDWMEHQMLHPEVMTKEDPIARQLLTVYATQMPNLGLSQDQVRTLIEFLKHQDHELGVIP